MRSEVGVVLPCLQPTPSRCSRWETKRAPAPGAFSLGVNPSRRGRGDLSITEVEGTQKDHRVHPPSSGSTCCVPADPAPGSVPAPGKARAALPAEPVPTTGSSRCLQEVPPPLCCSLAPAPALPWSHLSLGAGRGGAAHLAAHPGGFPGGTGASKGVLVPCTGVLLAKTGCKSPQVVLKVEQSAERSYAHMDPSSNDVFNPFFPIPVSLGCGVSISGVQPGCSSTNIGSFLSSWVPVGFSS